MEWFVNLFTNGGSIAHIVLLYSFVITLGVLLGKIKIGGISLGVTFVLFVGIIVGHFLHIGQTKYGFTPEPSDVLNFIQDFGLILFVGVTDPAFVFDEGFLKTFKCERIAF